MKKQLLPLILVLSLSVVSVYLISGTTLAGNNRNNNSAIDNSLPTQIADKEYYLSPIGDDNNGNGTIDRPWFSINKAWEVVKAGDIIYMKEGTYLYEKEQRLYRKNGTPGNYIKIWAVSGDVPVISPHDNYKGIRGIDINGDYIHIKGLEISGFTQRSNTSFYYGIYSQNSNNLILEQLSVHDNGFGLSIGGDSGDNLVLNSDFYRNADPMTSFDRNKPWGGADGITIRSSNIFKTNTIRGCRMWWNSDDGIDLFENQGTIIIENSWAFWNGYRPGTYISAGDGNGYKLGVTTTDQSTTERRILRYNLAFENKARGFDQNNALCITLLFNNTSYNNGNRVKAARSFDFWNGKAATVAKNNLDYKPTMSALFNEQSIVTYNTFHKDGSINKRYTVTPDDFVSLDSKGVIGPRQKDGSLPNLKFLKLAKGSDLIDKGIDIGLPYNGLAPDIGAYESDY